MKFYQQDLATVHDMNYGNIATNASIELLHLLQKNGFQGGTIVDLGCGSGILAKKLTENNYDLIGIDYSADILEIAKAKAPRAQFIQASFLEYELPYCQAVTATGEVINYLFDGKNKQENLLHFLAKVYRQLSPKGIFMFDFLSPNMVKTKSGIERKIIETADWTMFITYTENKTNHLFTRDIVLFKKQDNGLYRKSKEVHQIQLYDKKLIKNLLKTVGFKAKLVSQYNGEIFRKGHFGIIAQKR